MKSPQLVISIVAFAIASCGKIQPEAETNPPPQPVEVPRPAPDNSAEHEALGEEVLASIEKINSALNKIGDAQTAKAAAAEIESVGKNFEELAERMEQAGKPSPEIAERFRSRFAESQRIHEPQIPLVMTSKPDTIRKINRTLQAIGEIRAGETFKAYGF